jgi:hypothetical protein
MLARQLRRPLALFAIAAVGLAATAALAKGGRQATPLELPWPRLAAAAWVAPPVKPPELWPVAEDAGLALATRRGVGTPTEVLAYSATDGVVGPIALPAGTTWVGTGGGAIYAATDAGDLHRAATLADARAQAAARARSGAAARPRLRRRRRRGRRRPVSPTPRPGSGAARPAPACWPTAAAAA